MMNNVPKLRFKEFSGESNKYRIDSILERYSNPVQIEEDIDYREIGVRSHGKGIFHKELTNSEKLGNKRVFWVHPNAFIVNIVFAWEHAVALTSDNEDGLIASHRFPMYIPKDDLVDLKYLLYYFLKPYGKYLLELASPGGAGRNKTLGQNNFNELKINLPSKQEQQKIALFLTSIDTKIEQLTKKEELLKQYKKGGMQKIFSQEIRFKADDMRKGVIKDFGHFYYGKGAPKTSVTDDAPTPCVRYGELYSTYNELIKTIKSYTNIDPKNLKFSKGGEVLVPRVGEDPLDFANCSYLPLSGVAIGEMISVYNTKENGLYMTYYINTMLKKQFARVVEGGNVSNLYFKYLENIQLTIHSIDEQAKIVDFLQAIDAKIEQAQKQLNATKEFKKALLQQMFV